ncbi:MAG: T9SS type A sorting domain-containing protein [Bacteroidetes bacterium]|nr:T9SS type A sorting domain-containing protein [Bacteroidota bacterium]
MNSTLPCKISCRLSSKPVRILILGLLLTAWPAGAQIPESYQAFKDSLTLFSGLTSPTERTTRLNAFWNRLKAANRIPFAVGNQVAFMYKGAGSSSTAIAGDFNGWSPSGTAWQGKKVTNLDLHLVETTFPPDARLDYKWVIGGSNWILDPANPFTQMSGFGDNSELRMPNWNVSPWLVRTPGIATGKLSANIRFTSQKLGYVSQYRVYTPAGYDTLQTLSVLYVTDGHEYSADATGSLIIILDNLIAARLIEPLIVVFLDPRNPDNTSQNRRMNEYNLNKAFLDYVCDELVPVIDAAYRTAATADTRGILGTSMGGLNSAYFGAKRHDVFRRIAIQSPAFQANSTIYSLYATDRMPLKIFLSTGLIGDTQNQAETLLNTYLIPKDYEHVYKAVNEGHSWGNWRALNDDVLIYLFPPSKPVSVPESEKPVKTGGVFNYPNPFNPSTRIGFYLSQPSAVSLRVYDSTGREVITEQYGLMSAGQQSVPVMLGGFASGIYPYRLLAGEVSMTGRMTLLR